MNRLPPSIDVTEQKSKSNPSLHMYNEQNMFVGLITFCLVLMLSLYLQTIMDSTSMKQLSMGLCISGLFLLFYVLFVYKRNIDSFKNNEEEYINHEKTSVVMYCIMSALMVIYNCTFI